MSRIAQMIEGAMGEAHRPLLDALRADGPVGLSILLADVRELLVECATDPAGMFDAAQRDRGDFSALLGVIHESLSALEALEARAVVGLGDAISRDRRAEASAEAAQEDAEIPPEQEIEARADRLTARELSMVTRRSPAAARGSLATCRRLVRDMPHLLRALATGHAAPSVVHGAARSTAPLTSAQRREVDEQLGIRIVELDGAGCTRWGRAVDEAVQLADPGGEARRHRHARTRRHVTVRPGDHGMATVSAHLPAVDAALIGKRLSLEAERLRAHGDRRGHQQIQADVLADTLLGRSEEMDPTVLDLGVIITDRTLFSPRGGDAAHLEGYGVVPPEAIREAMVGPLSDLARGLDRSLDDDAAEARLQLRRLYTHPTSGELVGVESRARAFPRGLARFIRWRDMTCRGPFCDAPIRQIDHIDPVSAGGPTTLENGQGLCAWCNDKEGQTLAVEQVAGLDGHRIRWTSLGGITRVTAAERLTRSAGPRPRRPRRARRARRTRRVSRRAGDQGRSNVRQSVPSKARTPSETVRQ